MPPAGLGFLGVYFAMCMLGGDAVQGAQGAGNLFVALVTYPYQVAAGMAALTLAVFMVRHSVIIMCAQAILGSICGGCLAAFVSGHASNHMEKMTMITSR